MVPKRGAAQKPLYCFSPPVMIATCIIESGLLLYTLWRYKMSTLTRLIAATLALLAIFQAAEYRVCGHSFGVAVASRIGFMAITMLPPIGVHLVQTIAGKGWRALQWVSYLAAAIFVVYFGFGKSVFASYACSGNYAIFHLVPARGGEFFAYYYALLIIEVCIALYFAASATEKVRKALLYQVFGVLAFMIPTGITNAVNPATIDGIPSVMCGFAVIYAIVLVFGTAPFTLKLRRA